MPAAELAPVGETTLGDVWGGYVGLDRDVNDRELSETTTPTGFDSDAAHPSATFAPTPAPVSTAATATCAAWAALSPDDPVPVPESRCVGSQLLWPVGSTSL